MNRFVILSLALVALSAVAARRYGNGKKMVCYVGTWAMYRPGDGKFVMEDIDPSLCTHVMYGFTKLENNQITVFDPWGDLTPTKGGGLSGYQRFTDLKKKNSQLKTIVAIGGWNEGSENYSNMAKDASSRSTFVKSIVPFLKEHNFDGLDLDWEYPTQRGGVPEDRENFSALVRELREELDRAGRGYTLTAAVSPNTKTVDMSYEVEEIARNLDFINVMCYDYHGYWEGHEFTGHNTPLYRHPLDDQFEPTFNANDTVTFWLNAGLPKEKLIMGMALYGRGFTLKNSEEHGLYAPISGGIPMGPYTRQDGIWGYNEICETYMKDMSQWKITIDPYVKAPYAHNGKEWIGYEDVESLYYKAEYARNMDLGGAMVWSLETDDFRGKCHGEKYILLKTILNTMNGGGMPDVPQRPEVVPADSENEIVPPPPNNKPHVPEDQPHYTTDRPSGRPTRTSRTRRTTTEYYPSEEEYTTSRRPRPERTSRPPRTSRPRPSTTEYYPSEEEYTTSRRPSPERTSRPPRTSRPRPSTTEYYPSEEEVTNRPSRRTTGRPSASGECQEEGIYPVGNCTQFYHCVRRGKGFTKITQNCPAGTAFNPEIKGCDHADQVPGCGAVVRAAISYRLNGQ